jgi:hypothetical protein
MSCAETPFEVLLKGVTLYLNPLYQKSKLRMKIPIVCMHLKNMNYALVINEYKY